MNTLLAVLQVALLLVVLLGLYVTERTIMATVKELAAELTAIKDQVTKAKAEILKKIADLEEALANVALPPEAEAALAALKSEVQTVDDIVPDAPPPPPPPPPV